MYYYTDLLYHVISCNFLFIPVATEKTKVKLALAIPAGAPNTIKNEIIDTPPRVALNTIKILSISLKIVTYLFNFL